MSQGGDLSHNGRVLENTEEDDGDGGLDDDRDDGDGDLEEVDGEGGNGGLEEDASDGSTIEYEIPGVSGNGINQPLEDSYGSDSDTTTESTIFVKESDEEELSDTSISDNPNEFKKPGKTNNSLFSTSSDKRLCSTSVSELPITPSAKRSYDEMHSDRDEEDQICPICLEIWTSEGSHRLSSLKCGHLFGKSCITNWLVKQKKNCCPQCNKKASSYEIRELFATKLVALDCSEKTKLEREIETVKEEKRQVEVELARCRLFAESYKMEVQKLQSELAKFIGKTDSSGGSKQAFKFHLEKTLPIADGSCRVCAYDSINKMLLVCHHTKNLLFNGFGVKRILKLGTDYVSNNFLHLHLKTIRDIRFHPLTPNVILTVAFDKCAKICDLEKQSVIQTFTADYALWSCCWDEEEPNFFYVGNGKGVVYMYDARSPSNSIAELKLEGDTSSVVSISYVPRKPPQNLSGGILCCRLNSVVYYEKNGTNGFKCHRPSTAIPNVRHAYCELDEDKCQPVHVFVGGSVQSMLSRPCFVKFDKETLLAVFQESSSSVELWSTSSGLKVSNFHVREEIYDLSSMTIGARTFIAAIASSAVRFYEAS